jgi:hypothetical protein
MKAMKSCRRSNRQLGRRGSRIPWSERAACGDRRWAITSTSFGLVAEPLDGGIAARFTRCERGARNRRNLRRTEKKEAAGRTGQQEREGKSRVGAHRQRESTRAMSGKDARKTTARGRKAATARARKLDGHTRQELYAKAKRRHIEGRSKMSKRQLENALGMR